MTDDNVRITRRISLEKYEFYEIEVTLAQDLLDFEQAIKDIENKVEWVRNYMGEPSPEISPKKSDDDPYPGLLFYDDQSGTVRLTKYLKDEKWKEINTYLRGLGYKWVSAGKDSRWER